MTDAAQHTYSPADPTIWTNEPDSVADGLDESARLADENLVRQDLDFGPIPNELPVYSAAGAPYTVKASGVLITSDLDIATPRNVIMSGDLTVGSEAFGIVYVNASPPASPQTGQLWLDTDGTGNHGAQRLPIAKKTGAYTITDTDGTILVDATSAAVAITLPAVSSVTTGIVYTVKKIDSSANAVTIDGSGAETIDGTTTRILSSQYDAAKIQSDGTEWWVI